MLYRLSKKRRRAFALLFYANGLTDQVDNPDSYLTTVNFGFLGCGLAGVLVLALGKPKKASIGIGISV